MTVIRSRSGEAKAYGFVLTGVTVTCVDDKQHISYDGATTVGDDAACQVVGSTVQFLVADTMYIPGDVLDVGASSWSVGFVLTSSSLGSFTQGKWSVTLFDFVTLWFGVCCCAL